MLCLSVMLFLSSIAYKSRSVEGVQLFTVQEAAKGDLNDDANNDNDTNVTNGTATDGDNATFNWSDSNESTNGTNESTNGDNDTFNWNKWDTNNTDTNNTDTNNTDTNKPDTKNETANNNAVFLSLAFIVVLVSAAAIIHFRYNQQV